MLALFDLDNTLVNRGIAFTEAIAALCNDHGYNSVIQEWLHTELADRANPADFQRLMARFDLPDDPARLWHDYVNRIAAAVRCVPEVLEGLAQLRIGGWTIGIATNGASDIQRAKLTATGLADHVDGIAVSGDIETRKPDRRLFELAARRCGTDLTDGGWMIGDNPGSDIGGGHAAGLRTIWLRGRPWPDGLAAAQHVVDDVTDAITILLNETE
ncbi:HAD family hydrolase [Streptomyces longhuiensis]|uniref:HAD family hydrolase n=1 Tax=Streptomyces longhuiensis TaxID=2880933 RepID=UPI001D0AE76A|nr:HAD family hydrolase [Streptomyces longhuiensis]UDM05548.1 HAD family hydrolase [Streptomyces longhuiensis]